jgi:hypothetical protein
MLQEHAAEFWTAAPRCSRSAASGPPVGRRDGQTRGSAHWAPPQVTVVGFREKRNPHMCPVPMRVALTVRINMQVICRSLYSTIAINRKTTKMLAYCAMLANSNLTIFELYSGVLRLQRH